MRKRLALTATILVISASCNGESRSSTTSPESQSSTTNAVSVVSSSTTTTVVAATIEGILLAGRKGLTISGATITHIPGDADIPVAASFDDFLGGVVFQYEAPLPESSASEIRHLPAASLDAIPLLVADDGHTLTLFDVERIEDRVMVLYLDDDGTGGQLLLAADLAGGATRTMASLADAGNPAGVQPNRIGWASLADNRVAIHWVVESAALSCSYIEVLTWAGEPVTEVQPCGSHRYESPTISPDGKRLLYREDIYLIAEDIDSSEELGKWPSGATTNLDFDGTSILIAEATTAGVISLSGGRPVVVDIEHQFASLIREPIELAPSGSFLGGVGDLSGPCSAQGIQTPPPIQSGLTVAVAEMRDAIVSAVSDCDFQALSSLTQDDFTFSFGGDGSPSRSWLAAEGRGDPVLADMARILDLPYAVEDSGGVLLYVWPSAFREDPSEDDWQALSLVYNEEDIEFFRQEIGAYIGLRIGITADGRWLFSVEGD